MDSFRLGTLDRLSHFNHFFNNLIAKVYILLPTDFKVGVSGMMMNNHYMAGTENYSVGFLDSGTTFTYLNQNLFKIV